MNGVAALADAQAFLEPTGLSNASAQANCPTYITGRPTTSDCTQAVAALHARSLACQVPNGTSGSENVTYEFADQYAGTYDVTLATAGQCQVMLGGTLAASLPCSTIADYAAKVIAYCSTSGATTGGVYYPKGVFGYEFQSVTPDDGDDSRFPPALFIAVAHT